MTVQFTTFGVTAAGGRTRGREYSEQLQPDSGGHAELRYRAEQYLHRDKEAVWPTLAIPCSRTVRRVCPPH